LVVDYGDGQGEQTYANGTAMGAGVSRAYATPGTYTVKIRRTDYSQPIGIKFNQSGSTAKAYLTKVTKWGGLMLNNSTFSGCGKLASITDTAKPLISSYLADAFSQC
jgi:hypothetical protein